MSVRLAPKNYEGGIQAGDAASFRSGAAIHAGTHMTDYEESITFRELYKGLIKSRRNVMWKDSVAGYSANGLKNTYKLRQALLSGKYKIDTYQVFEIHEPKDRVIMATRIKDRQFQRSLCDNILYPQMSRSFIRMDVHLHRYYRKHGPDGWVLQCDIKQYFSSTRHNVAIMAIKKRVSNPEAIRRAEEIIRSFGEDGVGIGLGSQVSQLTELAVLDDLDHYIKERLMIKYYLRYMDDFVLIHQDRLHLERCLHDIRGILIALGLQLNRKTQIYPLRHGVKFLKWRFILTDSGKVIRKKSPKSISDERRKLRKLKTLLDRGKIELHDIHTHYNSWRANAQKGNTRGLLIQMDQYYKTVIGEDWKNGKCSC
jgi:hypothetical protein